MPRCTHLLASFVNKFNFKKYFHIIYIVLCCRRVEYNPVYNRVIVPPTHPVDRIGSYYDYTSPILLYFGHISWSVVLQIMLFEIESYY